MGLNFFMFRSPRVKPFAVSIYIIFDYTLE